MCEVIGLFGTTAGPVWEWRDNAMSNGKPDTWSNSGMAALMSGDDVVCWFGDAAQYYPTEGDEPSDADKRAIAQVPAMLELVRSVYADSSDAVLAEMARKIVAELEKK